MGIGKSSLEDLGKLRETASEMLKRRKFITYCNLVGMCDPMHDRDSFSNESCPAILMGSGPSVFVPYVR